MQDRTANLLGALGLAVADRIAEIALEVLDRAGETPAALVVIGYGLGPSNDQLRRILGLSHPGMVRLVDRLVADGLVERQVGRDRGGGPAFLLPNGHEGRERPPAGPPAPVNAQLSPLGAEEEESLGLLLSRILAGLPSSDLERCHLCRMCDDRVCRVSTPV